MKSGPMPFSATPLHACDRRLSACFTTWPTRACVPSVPARAAELEEPLMNGVRRRETVSAKPFWLCKRAGFARSAANRVVGAVRRIVRPTGFLAALPRITRVGLATAALIMLTSPRLAQAQNESAKPKPANAAQVPMPPMRPANLPSAPPSSMPAPQQVPAVINPPARDPSASNSSSNPSFYRLHTLPPATRARMHECGLEWQRMKANGAATEETWYTFAQTCLAR